MSCIDIYFIWSTGDYFVFNGVEPWMCAILVDGIMGNFHVKNMWVAILFSGAQPFVQF